MFNNDKKFDIDLAKGKLGEQKLADILQDAKIEVKLECGLWKKTGNIAIEYESRGKLSGIATTEADWWFHLLSDEDVIYGGVFMPVPAMREIARQNYKQKRIVSGGDNNTSRLVLVSLPKLFECYMLKTQRW